jgi:hypothetical protein
LRIKPVLLAALIAFSFLVNLPLAAFASCPGSCSNNITGDGSNTSISSSSFTVTTTSISSGNFIVASTTCLGGDSVTSVTDTLGGGGTWTKDASDSQGSGSATLPLVESFWHSTALATGADTVTLHLQTSAAKGCSAYVAGFDTLANTFVGSVSDGNLVYVCTGGSASNNPCADNLQTYSNTVSALGSSMLIIQDVGINASSNNIFVSASGASKPPGFAAVGSSSSMLSPVANCTPLYQNIGSNCYSVMVWAWQSSLVNYQGGATLDMGVSGNPSDGSNCLKGTGAKCYAQVDDFTAVYSNQAAQQVTATVPCTFNQLQCWWYPMLFMLAFSGVFLMVAGVSKTPPKQAMFLFLCGLSFGSVVAVIFGLLTIIVPLALLVLNVLYVVRFRGR